MATGVLLLGIGRATRLLGHLALTDKTYVATIRLGATTVTDDAEGDVLVTTDASAVTDDDITAAMRELTGEIQQVPSSVSAIKVDGVRSYAKVRAGQEVDLAARRGHRQPVRTARAPGRRPRRRGRLQHAGPTSAPSPATSARR